MKNKAAREREVANHVAKVMGGHIKPFVVTMERGEDGKVFWREHYTHDDLVAVALATFEWAGFKVDPEGAEGKAANAIVERLTGVKR